LQQKFILVWDLPTRIVHWSIAVLIFFLWWTSDSADIVLHKRLGFGVLALLAFRFYWGFFGSETARFSDFLKGPAEIVAYLRKGISATLGHNPLGALESALGLFATEEDGLDSGPLSAYVSFENGQLAAHYHALVFNILLGFVALHIMAVIFYFALGQNLIVAMISGRKRAEPNRPEPRPATIRSLAIGIGLCAAVFAYLWHLDS
jgi:cytochrome b